MRTEDRISHPAFAVAGALLALPALAALVLALDPWLMGDWPMAKLLINVVPVWCVFLALFALTRRAFLALLLACVPLVLVFYINDIKLRELEQPLAVTDLALISQLFREIGLLVRYSHGAILLLVVGLVAGLACVFARFEDRQLGRRAALSLGAVTTVGLLCISTQPIKQLYADQGAYDMPWIPGHAVQQTGLIARLTASVSEDLRVRPSRDPGRLADVLEHIRSTETLARPADEPDEGQSLPAARSAGLDGRANESPDLVVILSESFFDPGILREVDSCEVIPAWCELIAEHIHGNVQVPTYGGNTTRTEFEILTGVPYSALPDGVYPYSSVVTRPTFSIAWALAAHGYRTTAVHPHSKRFWNRHEAMPALGFERFIAESDFGAAARSGLWISDAALTDRIVDTIEQSPDQPNFVFAISMENHGPWKRLRRGLEADWLESIPVPERLSPDQALELRQYLFHARNSVSELVRLKAWMAERERPTLLLFFGDHLPGLHGVFDSLGFQTDTPAHLQKTPYLVISNFAFEPDWMPGRSSELGLWVLHELGVPMPDVAQALAELRASPSLRERLDRADRMALYAELLAIRDHGKTIEH